MMSHGRVTPLRFIRERFQRSLIFVLLSTQGVALGKIQGEILTTPKVLANERTVNKFNPTRLSGLFANAFGVGRYFCCCLPRASPWAGIN